MTQSALTLRMRRQELSSDERGFFSWQPVLVEKSVEADRIAIVICDMWDDHWSRGAAQRVTAMAPRMNGVLNAARDRGARIINAPSETMTVYDGTPARRRMLDRPRTGPPALRERADPPLPVDDSDGGYDTG